MLVLLIGLALFTLTFAADSDLKRRASSVGSYSISSVIDRGSTSTSPATISCSSSAVNSAESVCATSVMQVTTSSITVSSSTPSVTTSNKRGLAYTNATLTDAFIGKGMSWAYNWDASPGGEIQSGLEYVPMLRNPVSNTSWASDVASAISVGSNHLLSFNEPDLPSQGNISASEAAAAHIEFMNIWTGHARIGTPAISSSGEAGQGIDWLTAWFAACNGNCAVDFVTMHVYMDNGYVDELQNQVNNVVALAERNNVTSVWITEFGLTENNNDSDAAAFLAEVLPWLDVQQAVERYAYFMCGDGKGLLLNGSSLSTVGVEYTSTTNN